MKRICSVIALVLATALTAQAQQYERGQWDFVAGISSPPTNYESYFNGSGENNFYNLKALYSPYYRDYASSLPVYAEGTWHFDRKRGVGGKLEYLRAIGTAFDPLTDKEVGEKSLNCVFLTVNYERIWWQWSWGAFKSRIGAGLSFMVGRNPDSSLWSSVTPVIDFVPYSFVFGKRVYVVMEEALNSSYMTDNYMLPEMRFGIGYRF